MAAASPAGADHPSVARSAVLLGDSTIDNVVWVDDPREQVPELLRKALPDWTIHNFAADGFTSSDVLEGGFPVISHAKRTEHGDSLPLPATYLGSTKVDKHEGIAKFYPLQAVEKLVAPTKGNPPACAVLSVGGNDFREVLGCMSPELLLSLRETVPANVVQIARRLQAMGLKVVIMLQYQPAVGTDGMYGVYEAMAPLAPVLGIDTASLHAKEDLDASTVAGMAALRAVMSIVYRPVLDFAAKERIPVVDLPRSLDCTDPELFRCQIEPSPAGGAIIAKLIANVLSSHDWSKSCCLYRHSRADGGDGAVVAEPFAEGDDWEPVDFGASSG